MPPVGGAAAYLAVSWYTQHQRFALQAQQLETIRRLGQFPPPDCDPDTWRNAIVTPSNVWGNVTFHPSYSKISNTEMRDLLSSLEAILERTTQHNSQESVDQVFALLLQRGDRIEFISGYREEFSDYCKSLKPHPVAVPGGPGQ